MAEKKIDGDVIHLINHLIKMVDLPEFVETEAGADLNWSRGMSSAKCHCPLPSHKDGNASFHMNLMEEDVWIYHCFGCGAKGNIIHFCMDFFELNNKAKSVVFLCKKLGIKNTDALILEGLKNVNKRVDTQRLIENANILVSNQCRMLLRNDYNKHAKWVTSAYKRLNIALRDNDELLVEEIGYEASQRIHC